MQLIAYLAFDGNCREAFEFYRAALGGEFVYVATFGESPMAADMPPETHDRLMHIHLQVGGAALMGSDGGGGEGCEASTAAGSTTVNISVDTPDEAERIWAKLSEGAQVTMPLAPTFWAQRFGMLKDRFGKPWMVNCPTAQPPH
ncbi:VOC family protein [Cognatilysobacter terrigena]|uniref:VOC family protein n=1 Tax=Cognatilysobacter terrigena TaxID=2488749 RepID=UPI0010610CA4|nr:VOC family protein [Lysobacter terrigena]